MDREQLLQYWGEPQHIHDLSGLNEIGMIRLVDVMGDDSSIVQAARVSYGAGTKTVREDEGLIRYLIRHAHTTPLEMCEIKLHVQCPIDVMRQWIRHRTASVNEFSTRYSVVETLPNNTVPGTWRSQSTTNKQGSAGYLDQQTGVTLSEFETTLHDMCYDVYNTCLDAGVSREQARRNLPLCTRTEFYWKINLHNLLHFLRLRMDSHAQEEIRVFANKIWEIVKDWVPLAAQAFSDYRMNSVSFGAKEIEALKFLLSTKAMNIIEDEEQRRLLFDSVGITSRTERIEFVNKFRRFYD